MAGVRSSKTVGSTTYHYNTLSGLVMHQSWQTSSGVDRALYFVYDDSNQPYMVVYKNGTSVTRYFYLLNLQGDVVGMIDYTGAIIALYRYDPWGAVTVLNPDGTENATASFIGNLNPLRYRGYYYDSDTGLYYLQSRYYDPAIGRFINADTFATTDAQGFLSCNMFAYCENNPVNKADYDGKEANWVTKVAVVTVAACLVIAAPVVVIGTGIAGTAIGITIISTSAVIASRSVEVASLQYKKSVSEGIPKEVSNRYAFEAVYDNAARIVTPVVTKKAFTTTGRLAVGKYMATILNRSWSIGSSLGARANPILSSIGVGISIINTIVSIRSKNAAARAEKRGYLLK